MPGQNNVHSMNDRSNESGWIMEWHALYAGEEEYFDEVTLKCEFCLVNGILSLFSFHWQ
jgi:hypothetical protein